MRTYDSSLNYHHVNSSLKYKDYESFITKPTNLTDVKVFGVSSKDEKVLIDRSNQIFMPKTASKYVEGPNEKLSSREIKIQQIRKKYNQKPEYKTQKYDRYLVSEQKDQDPPKRGTNRYQNDQNKHYGQTHDAKRRQTVILSTVPNKLKGQNNPITQIRYTSSANKNRFQQDSHERQPSNNNHKLDEISQERNSNYKTNNRNFEESQPQRNRARSSYVVGEHANTKRKNQYPPYCMDSSAFRNLNQQINYKCSIRQMKSIQDHSVKNYSGGTIINKSSKYQHNESSSTKPTKIQPKIQLYTLKPFGIQQTTGTSKKFIQKNNYSTIQNNYLPESYTNNNNAHEKTTSRKAREFNDYSFQDSNKRSNSTELQSSKNSRLYVEKNDPIKRALQFQDPDRFRQIQRKLKQRQMQYIKREQIKSKYQRQQDNQAHQYDRRISTNKMTQNLIRTNGSFYTAVKFMDQQVNLTPYGRPNIQDQIERLSSKNKQSQDRKKQLNVSYITEAGKRPTQLKTLNQGRQYEDARKTLEQFRRNGRTKSTHEISYTYLQPCTNLYKISPQINNDQYQLFNTMNKTNDRMYKQRDLAKRCEFIQNTQPIYSQRTLSTTHKKAQSNNRLALRLFRIQSQAEESSSESSKLINLTECRNQFQIKKRTDNGIEQRRKFLLSNNEFQPRQSLKQLVSLLSQQCTLDQEFRNCKIWFHMLRAQNKWKQLKRNLRDSNQKCTKFNQLKDGTLSQFLLSEDQNNPFFSVNQQSKFTCHALIQSYAKSKNFWEQNLVRKYDRNSLKAQGFTSEKVDMEKKGFIILQDLVRFLNLQSGKFYRNRDLYLIFTRFLKYNTNTPQKTLSIEKILNVLGK